MIYVTNQRIPTEKAYGIQIAKMCEAFAELGAKVTLVFPFRESDVKDDFFRFLGVKSNFSLKEIWAPDFYLPGKLDKLAFAIKSFISALILSIYALIKSPPIIYCRDELPVYLMSFFRKNILFEAHKFSKSKGLFYRRLNKIGVRVVVISEGLQKKFIQAGFAPERILVARDAVDLRDFDISISLVDARRKLNLPPDAKIVLYAGHLFDWKGVGTLAEVAKLIPDCLFVFVGGTEADINDFKKKYGGNWNVRIIGYKSHAVIPYYLKAANVLVLPNSSKNELSSGFTSPLKLFEYMASKRPIVASDLPSIREILDENSAVLVEPDSPEALAGGIKRIFENPRFSEEISGKAFENMQDYTWQKRAEGIIKFIGQAL